MELDIRSQCADCPLRAECETREGARAIAAAAIHMAVSGEETMQPCRHPWRTLNEIYHGEPTEDQQIILATLVSLRGKNPADYGLPKGLTH